MAAAGRAVDEWKSRPDQPIIIGSILWLDLRSETQCTDVFCLERKVDRVSIEMMELALERAEETSVVV
jgi:hypothetical protein